MGDIKIDNNKITEQSYLELAKTSQEKFNELDSKNRKLTNQINELKKSVVCAYALSRKIDEFLDDIEMASSIKNILEYLVSECRKDLSTAVFNLEHNDELEELETVNLFVVN